MNGALTPTVLANLNTFASKISACIIKFIRRMMCNDLLETNPLFLSTTPLYMA